MSDKKDWEVFLDEGRAYHKTAKGSLKRPEVFTPGIVQNICAMAIEKYFMAIFTQRGLFPANHTMTDFIEGMKSIAPLEADLEKKLRRFDELQSICSLEFYKIEEPQKEDI